MSFSFRHSSRHSQRILFSAFRSSVVAPAILPWRWLWWCFRVQSGLIEEPRVGIGAVEASPRRIVAAEDILRGAKPSRELYEQAARVAADSIDPLTDARYDGAYRRDLTTSDDVARPQ
jgi:hypothetical protein